MRARTPQEFADAVRRQVLWMRDIAEKKAVEWRGIGPQAIAVLRQEHRARAFQEVLDLIDSEISSEPVPTPRPIGA